MYRESADVILSDWGEKIKKEGGQILAGWDWTIRLVGMSELQPIIPARDDTNPSASSLPAATTHDPIDPPPITDQEVGEYREQDRFLPVCFRSLLPSPPHLLMGVDRQCVADNEGSCPSYSQDCQGRKGMRARMCVRVYILYNFRGSGEMSDGKEEDDRWGGYSVCYGHSRL